MTTCRPTDFDLQTSISYDLWGSGPTPSPPHFLSLRYRIRIYIYIFIQCAHIPVVLHKAAAEVSRIGHYRRGELL